MARFASRALAPPVRLATMSFGTVNDTLRLLTSMTKVSLDSFLSTSREPVVPDTDAGCPPWDDAASLLRYLRSSHLVLTSYAAPCSAVNSSSLKICSNRLAGVGTPSTFSSLNARRTRATAAARSDAVTTSLPIIESNFGEMVSPSTTPESTRIPGPDGQRSEVSVPELGARFFAGSSQVRRSSKLCPRSGWFTVNSPPLAMVSCSRTRSSPQTSSLTVCSTCRRGLTSRKYTLPCSVTMNSQVPRPS